MTTTPQPQLHTSILSTRIRQDDEQDKQSDTIDSNTSNTTTTSSSRIIHISKPATLFVPPLNFALVEDGIYRSGFPMPINYPFLTRLGIKTIIYLGDLGHEKVKPSTSSKKGKKDVKEKKKDKYGALEIFQNYQEWLNTTDITFHNLLIDSLLEPFNVPEEHEQALKSLSIALQLLLNKNNFPVLIHSNKGKHRTGLLVGLMRKLLQGWCLSGIFEEYEKFAMGKSEFDLELIELWQPELWVDENNKPDFVRI